MWKILKKIIKKSLYFLLSIKNLFIPFIYILHRYFLTKKYTDNNKIRKLHLGAGNFTHEGWLASDLFPKIGKSIIYIDASKRLPFPDNYFDFIYSEHMIEHISYDSAQNMLKECNRVLKKNGKIRISTPDLDKYLSLFDSEKSEIQEDFIDFMSNNWLQKFKHNDNLPYHILNLNMHAWGHSYIYCKSTLKDQLVNAKFSDIKFHKNNESLDPIFLNMELHGSNLEKQFSINNATSMVDFETMNAEASKE